METPDTRARLEEIRFARRLLHQLIHSFEREIRQEPPEMAEGLADEVVALALEWEHNTLSDLEDQALMLQEQRLAKRSLVTRLVRRVGAAKVEAWMAHESGRKLLNALVLLDIEEARQSATLMDMSEN